VDPPIVLYPQQLGRVPLGLRRDEMAFVEVLLSEDGKVLRVKALEPPSTLDESMVLTMSLSAAKSWRFQPARKDGRAVKYRQVLPVSLR
jgi:outer membrane biosynthesis protein TonB